MSDDPALFMVMVACLFAFMGTILGELDWETGVACLVIAVASITGAVAMIWSDHRRTSRGRRR